MRLNDLDFHVEIEGDGPPLLLLHGFTGSGHAWDQLRPGLARSATVIALDLIGHGRSAAPEGAERYTLDWASRDLLALLDALDLPSVDVLGYSMGGRVALHFAVHHPERVRVLVLESASPGLQDAAERAARITADEALAERIEANGIEAFVAEWEALPLLALAPHVSEQTRAEQHAQRLSNTPVGLANSLRGMGAGRQAPLWSALAGLDLPVQVIVGANDRRYCAIGQRMHAALPRSGVEIVSDAGHTVHLDQPRHVLDTLTCVLCREN